MAKVESLGVHVPVGLPYLIREGILPQDANPDRYQWEVYVHHALRGDVEEEVLATKDCVIWSQGKFVRNVYRFGLEGEDVVQAILTNFPNARGNLARPAETTINGGQTRSNGADGSPHSLPESPPEDPSSNGSASRALVILLKTKAHIYFLYGARHIIHLPFEVERASPAPRGVLLQRKPPLEPPASSTPSLPSAPPNSFFSSQLHPSSSYGLSPTLPKSFTRSQPVRPSPLGGNNMLDSLFATVLGPSRKSDEEDMAGLYSLTGPLSDLGVVTSAMHVQRPRLSAKHQPNASIEFETLDPAETVVYVSTADELANDRDTQDGPLTLIVTANNELQTVTVWHAWYIEEKPLHALMAQRKAQATAKARRRSSFMSTMGTGTTTPAVRHREATRESLGASLRLPGEPSTSQPAALSTRKSTRQDEEAVMASQMDPDYQLAPSQPPARESRRISSRDADLRASQIGPAASFGGPASRRNASFGGPNDRKSFGHRKSRGSTPGSVYSRSHALDDDLDLTGDFDDEESVDEIVKHIRATYDAAGADSVFGGVDQGYKREMVVRKLHSISAAFPMAKSRSPRFKVVTLKEAGFSTESGGQRLSIYVRNQLTRDLVNIRIVVKQRELWPHAGSARVAVPLLIDEINTVESADILKLKHGKLDAISLAGQGLVMSSGVSQLCPLPFAPYRMYNALDGTAQQITAGKDVGRNRLLQPPGEPLQLQRAGAYGTYDEVGADNVNHRRSLQLEPRLAVVRNVLAVCEFVLPSEQAVTLRWKWCQLHAALLRQGNDSHGTGSDMEWTAIVATIFTLAVPLLDKQTRAALKLSKLSRSSSGKQPASSSSALQVQRTQHEARLFAGPGWSWVTQATTKLSSVQSSPHTAQPLDRRKNQLLPIAGALADEYMSSSQAPASSPVTAPVVQSLMIALHIFREEHKLCTLSRAQEETSNLAPVIAQLGSWLGITAWSSQDGQYYALEGASPDQWAYVKGRVSAAPQASLMDAPLSIFSWFERALQNQSLRHFPSLADMAASAPLSPSINTQCKRLTPRTSALSSILVETLGFTVSPAITVELMAKHGITGTVLETLPEGLAAPFREAIARCEKDPPTTWPSELLQLIDRDDLDITGSNKSGAAIRNHSNVPIPPRDVQMMCHALDHHTHTAKTKEAGRHAVSQQIFSEDRRLVEATSLMHFNSVQVAECEKQPEWSDGEHLEVQRKVMTWVAIRMIALPAGEGMIHFDSQSPLLTEKYHLPGFNANCMMQPMGHILTIDRAGLTEEKVNWAYFHAGVAAGLKISRQVEGIDTSWIAFNKPNELTNRHAGLLLALGLGGHLRSLAKWLSFKYLTPKHTMTSVGLLLGLSASYIGTMDSLITRMLSVHITRMLPPGAAELNVSPTTQTAGLMGIGLLYHNTQHRRMSEVMMSEIEYMEVEDPDSGPDPLRDESYRLAAGFALGFINLGKGADLRGLHGMYLPERLLAVAVGPRPVPAVHVFDRATAGAIIAVALVYMKSGDRSIAAKIDIPDTEAQFDHVRPDMLMLRAMAHQIILWDDIDIDRRESPDPTKWIVANLPRCYRDSINSILSAKGRYPFRISDIPFYNIATGLAWALSLKYAGSGNTRTRDEILALLDAFTMVKGREDSYYYDAKLARTTIRRCIDVLALAAATVMAGTGDLNTFRYLRRLHGRVDSETPYGSHLAAHLAIGTLFLAGGTYTFGTSSLSIASLMCAFYPLFPTEVHDNRCHLQAFRHMWVFATEARCLVVEDVDTQRPLRTPIRLCMRDGEVRTIISPCLLPELEMIATVQTDDPAYWKATLDFTANPAHLPAFRRNQRILVRRCPAAEAHSSTFSTSLAALNAQPALKPQASASWQSIFTLPAFEGLDKADLELVLPPDALSGTHTDEKGTVVDDRLVLSRGGCRDELWGLRALFAWADRAEGLRWLGDEEVQALKAKIEQRRQAIARAA